MRIPNLAAAVIAALAACAAPASAQRTGDQSRLVFTVSAGYVAGTSLWHVPDQPVAGNRFDVGRSIQGRLGGGMAATYYKGEHLGLTADVFAFELAYGDGCRVLGTATEINRLGCQDIDETERSALAAVISVGGIFRMASREMVSPFARVGVGILISNQSSIIMSGLARPNNLPPDSPPFLVRVYDDDRKSRVGAALGLGVGFTTPISRGFQFRWEVRDNIVGIQRVDGASPENDLDPPHGITYKHLFSLIAGVDLVLERSRGRRY
jgi:opacity protein-like surface antigen